MTAEEIKIYLTTDSISKKQMYEDIIWKKLIERLDETVCVEAYDGRDVRYRTGTYCLCGGGCWYDYGMATIEQIFSDYPIPLSPESIRIKKEEDQVRRETWERKEYERLKTKFEQG